MDGVIDDVRIYDRAFSPRDASRLYTFEKHPNRPDLYQVGWPVESREITVVQGQPSVVSFGLDSVEPTNWIS